MKQSGWSVPKPINMSRKLGWMRDWWVLWYQQSNCWIHSCKSVWWWRWDEQIQCTSILPQCRMVRLSQHTTQLQYYPSKIPGFIRHENEVRAVVQCSVRPIPWSMLEQKFICSFELCSEHGEEQIVPMSSRRSDPLCVVKDYGATKNKYLLVLLKGQWSEYFARFVTRVNG